MRNSFLSPPGITLPVSPPAFSLSAADAPRVASRGASPPAAEDRFIGVANYEEFLHNPLAEAPRPPRSAMAARYSRALESRVGLRSGGVMRYGGGPGAADSPWAELLPADDPPGAATPTGPEGRGGCHTPIRSASVESTRGCVTPRGEDVAEEHQEPWGTRVNNLLCTPVSGPVCAEAFPPATGVRTGAVLHTTPISQLRTPVWDDNDLLNTPAQMGRAPSGCVSQTESPVPRRNALLFQHMSTPRQTKTRDWVLEAVGLSLSDNHGRPNFNPLCWGYLGLVIALKSSVHLWLDADKIVTILEVPPTRLLTAVAHSKHPPGMGEILFAAGLDNGFIIVCKYAAKTHKPVVFEEGVRATLQHHDCHVSTLQIEKDRLFSGCMGGNLVMCNLQSGAILWKYDHSQLNYTRCVPVRAPEDNNGYSNANNDAKWRINVGDPIYKVELTQDGEYVAVGTTDSLFVYHVSCLGPCYRRKRKVFLTKAPQPVRAFCWWGTKHQRDYMSSERVSSGGINLNTFLVYAGGADGSILFMYSVGQKKDMWSYPMAAPILAIVCTEASDEILVFLDLPDPQPGPQPGSRPGPQPGSRPGPGSRPAADPFGAARGEADLYDTSSDDEGLSSVLYVDRHLAAWPARPARPARGGALRGPDTEARAPMRPMRLEEEAAVRPAAPQANPPRGGVAGMNAERLQFFQVRDGGDSVEYIGAFREISIPPVYVALSPDDALVATAGIDLRLRLKRVKARQTERVEPCAFR